MTNGMRILVGTLAAILAIAGSGAAQAPDIPLHDSHDIATEAGSLGAEYGLHDEGNYGDLDAAAAADGASAALDADGSVARLDDEKGLWSWLSLRFGAFVSQVAQTLGLDLAAEGDLELYASEDGIDLDATLLGETSASAEVGAAGAALDADLDETPAGELDGKTWELMGEADAAREQAPALPLP